MLLVTTALSGLMAGLIQTAPRPAAAAAAAAGDARRRRRSRARRPPTRTPTNSDTVVDHRRPPARQRQLRHPAGRHPDRRTDPGLRRLQHRRTADLSGAPDPQLARPRRRPAGVPGQRPPHLRLPRDPGHPARGHRADGHPARGGRARIRLPRRPARGEFRAQGQFPLAVGRGHRPRARPRAAAPPPRSRATPCASPARPAGRWTPSTSAPARCTNPSATSTAIRARPRSTTSTPIRTLLWPERAVHRARHLQARPQQHDPGARVSASLEDRSSLSFNGLPGVILTVPAGNPVLASPTDVAGLPRISTTPAALTPRDRQPDRRRRPRPRRLPRRGLALDPVRQLRPRRNRHPDAAAASTPTAVPDAA